MPLREGGRDSEWVIARGLSLFISVSCSAVPRKRREAFVTTAVRRTVPFADPAWHVSWSGDLAMVWAWPQEDLTGRRDDAGIDQTTNAPADLQQVSRVRRFIPESLLRGEPRESGLELLECSDGVEARAWRSGALYASSWWPQTPDASAWVAFCRGAGMPPQPMPEALPSVWREQSWTIVRGGSLQDTLAQYQRLAIPVALALVLLTAGWQAGALVRIQLARTQLDAEITASSQKVSDVLAARNRAETDLAATRRLLAMRPPSPQIRLMAKATQALAPLKATIVQWTMPNPATLELVVSMNSPNPRALVLAFQKLDAFDDVSVDIGRGATDQVIVRAHVRPMATLAPPSAANQQPGSAS